MSRGRKEGSVSGKRPIFWVCVAFSNNLIVEKIYSIENSSDEDIRSFTSEEAAKFFKEKHNIQPEQIIGPCYDVKALKNNTISTVKEIKKSINNTNISAIIGSGVYDGWSGAVFSIVGNSEDVLFIASNRLDKNINKILPPATPIKKELINFIS